MKYYQKMIYHFEIKYEKITYKKEIKLGDKIICKYTNKDNKHKIIIESKDGTILHSIIEIY